MPTLSEMDGKCWYEPGTPAGFRGRAVPDIAAYADLEAGYRIVVGGVHTHGGGTSADDMPWLNQVIYEAASDAAFRSIDRGDNGTKPGVLAWQAKQGYDHCTGLGVPDGMELLKRMLGG